MTEPVAVPDLLARIEKMQQENRAWRDTESYRLLEACRVALGAQQARLEHLTRVIAEQPDIVPEAPGRALAEARDQLQQEVQQAIHEGAEAKIALGLLTEAIWGAPRVESLGATIALAKAHRQDSEHCDALSDDAKDAAETALGYAQRDVDHFRSLAKCYGEKWQEGMAERIDLEKQLGDAQRQISALRDLVKTWRGMNALASEQGPIRGDETGHISRWTAVEMCANELQQIVGGE